MHKRPVVFRLTNSLHYGGIAARMRTVLPQLCDDFDLHVVTYRKPGVFAQELADNGITVHHLPIPTKWSPPGIYRLAGMLRRHGAAIIHNHSFSANVTGTIAGVLAGTPVRIGQIHTLLPHWTETAPLHRWKQRTEEALIHRMLSTVVLHGSLESIEYFSGQMPCAASKFELLHNGVDFQRLSPRMGAREMRRQHGIPDNVKVIGYVGRIAGVKRPDLILRVARAALGRNVMFVIVGGETEKVTGLQLAASSMGLDGTVLCIPETPHPGDYYNMFDAFIFVSQPKNESTPGAVLEACSFGLPVICVASETLAEIATYYDGFHPFEETADPVPTIEAALAAPRPDPARLRAHFSIQAMADRTRALYHRLLQHPTPRT